VACCTNFAHGVLFCFVLVVSTSAIDCVKQLVFETSYYILSGTLNCAHSLILLYAVAVTMCFGIVWCRGYVQNIIISKLYQPSSTSDWNNFISARGNLPEIISELFQKRIAAHEYFPTCSLSLR